MWSPAVDIWSLRRGLDYFRIRSFGIVRVARLCGSVEQTEDAFVHAKHDGGAGYGSHEMGSEAAVEAHQALLDPDELEALDQPGVLGQAVLHRRLS